jgi:nicotinate phosphoribosyltransferase
VIKLSEQPIKISNPGILQVKRLRKAGELVGDVIYDTTHSLSAPELHDINDPSRPAYAPDHDDARDMLVTVLDHGELVAPLATLTEARARAASELAALSSRTRRFSNPQPYPVGLDPHVHARKLALIASARSKGGHA